MDLKQSPSPTADSGPTKQELFIVGIGTSAGGLEALQNLLDYYEPQPNVAIVIVQHLSPDYKSLMVELLSKHTKMQVLQVKNGMKVEPECVYVMPARKNLSVREGKLYLKEKDPLLSIDFPIDIFFHSLGSDQEDHAVAIILSGTGTDGSRGIKSIKEKGGIVIVQEPASAKFNGMPISAITTKFVDYVLAPSEIALEIQNVAKMMPSPEIMGSELLSTETRLFNQILNLILKTTDIDFNLYKQNTIHRRIDRRMKLVKLENLEAYYQYLLENPKEISTLQKDLLIGVTQFFRDPEAFQSIANKMIPKLFEQKEDDETIRVWIPGCSTGEEVYSMLILMEEYKSQHERSNPIKMFATDIDAAALETAGNGIYPVNIATDVSKDRLNRFFVQKEQFYQIHQDLRNQIVFARHNLISDPPFNRVDLIVCRNLLIYFGQMLQKKVFSIFRFALNRDGFLFLGPSESLGELAKLVTVIDKRWKIYQTRSESKVFMPDMLLSNPVLPQAKTTHSFPLPNKAVSNQLTDQFRDILVDRFGPMTAFVNSDLEAIYLSGGINKYIRLPEKRLSLNLLKMLPDELMIPVNTAFRKVMKTKKKVSYKSIVVKSLGPKQLMFDVDVDKLAEMDTSEPIYLICLYLHETEDSAELDPLPENEMAVERIQFLEQQLKDTRENLQSTIEELETSNEELQASNEELMAANEELQSTNEELQSVNEELHTVNSELQQKIAELTQVTNDLDNLLKSTEIGTIFLDRELRIRKFTPAIQNQFNLIEEDLGRPISHFNTDLGGEDIVVLANKVLNSKKRLSKRIVREDGLTLFMWLLPYRTEDNQTEGVVINFIDVEEFQERAMKQD